MQISRFFERFFRRKSKYIIIALKTWSSNKTWKESRIKSWIRVSLQFVRRKIIIKKKYLKEHLNKEFIESSTAFYASSILFAKKSDDEFRFCVNYKKLNAIIKKNRYLISLIAKTIARLLKTKWMTKIDIRHVFNRIRMHSKKDENLTTFRTKYKMYKYLVMFFELINESSIFQNFMNDILMNYLNEFVITYLNDIIVYSNSKKEHIKHVRKILQRLREAEIQIDVDKYEFHITETKFLEMIVRRDEIKINFEKVRIIVKWDTSNHVKKIQDFWDSSISINNSSKIFSRSSNHW